MEWALEHGALRLPLASDGANALDSVPWLLYWNDHDYGEGWLSLDNAFFGAFLYTRGKGAFVQSTAQ